MRNAYIVALVAFTLCSFVSSVKLPDRFPRCRKVKSEEEIPVFENCFLNVTQQWTTYLKQGIPELKIPSLDPLVIPEITIDQNGPVSYVLKLHNSSFRGLTDYNFKYFKYFYNMTFNGISTFKDLKIKGTYDLKGDFFGLRFGGNGPWNANLSDITSNVWVDEELYTKKNKQYLNVTKMGIDTTIGEAKAHLGNFFGRNEVLNSALNNFLAEFSGEIIDVLMPDIKSIMARVLNSVSKRLTAKIPYDEFFLPE